MMRELAESEQEMMLKALHEYREACQPPELTADCPFAEPIEQGVRDCDEQCAAILARYAAPRKLREVEIGNGIFARIHQRPRARHRHHIAVKPFDTREIYLSDRGIVDVREWRLSALLSGILESIATSPMGESSDAVARSERIEQLAEEVRRRGLEPFEIIESEARFRIVGAVFSEILHASRSAESETPSDLLIDWVPAVKPHIEGLNAESDSESIAAVEALLNVIRDWAEIVELDDIINWRAPDGPPSITSPVVGRTVNIAVQWLRDRYLQTYVEHWNSDSLSQEWKYLHGELEPPCAPREMRERVVEETELSKAISDRFSHRERAPSSLGAQLKPAAVKYLEEGQVEKAITLFEAATRQDDLDPEAHNNLGFCLLGKDPDRAISHFGRSVSLGWPDKPIAEANQVLATAIAGRLTVALDMAQAFLEFYRDAGLPGDVYMWNVRKLMDEDSLVLESNDDLYEYVASIDDAIRSRVEGPFSADAQQ